MTNILAFLIPLQHTCSRAPPKVNKTSSQFDFTNRPAAMAPLCGYISVLIQLGTNNTLTMALQ